MIKFLVLLPIIAQCYAYSGYGVIGGGGGGGGYGNSGNVIPAAVKSKWSLDIIPVHSQQEQIQPQIIEIPPIELPVKILYNSRSSGVYVQQVHHPGSPGQTEATKSEEEPHRLSHEVIRPVIQELKEVIVPYRRIVQEIQPVVEDIQTIVAKGEGRQNSIGGTGGIIPSAGANNVASGGSVAGSIGSLYGGGKGSGGSGGIDIMSLLRGSGSSGKGAGAAALGVSSYEGSYASKAAAAASKSAKSGAAA